MAQWLTVMALDATGLSSIYRLKSTARVACPVFQVGTHGVAVHYFSFLDIITNKFRNVCLFSTYGGPWKIPTVMASFQM